MERSKGCGREEVLPRHPFVPAAWPPSRLAASRRHACCPLIQSSLSESACPPRRAACQCQCVIVMRVIPGHTMMAAAQPQQPVRPAGAPGTRPTPATGNPPPVSPALKCESCTVPATIVTWSQWSHGHMPLGARHCNSHCHSSVRITNALLDSWATSVTLGEVRFYVPI